MKTKLTQEEATQIAIIALFTSSATTLQATLAYIHNLPATNSQNSPEDWMEFFNIPLHTKPAVDRLIRHKKFDEALYLLKSHLPTLPPHFQPYIQQLQEQCPHILRDWFVAHSEHDVLTKYKQTQLLDETTKPILQQLYSKPKAKAKPKPRWKANHSKEDNYKSYNKGSQYRIFSNQCA